MCVYNIHCTHDLSKPEFFFLVYKSVIFILNKTLNSVSGFTISMNLIIKINIQATY